MDSDSQVIGVWSLLSFDLYAVANPNAGSIFQPLGKDVLGKITFGTDGYMNCMLTSRESTEKLDATWVTASDETIANVARTFTAYCGPYKTYTENNEALLATQVEVALDPSWIGGRQVRKWQVTKNGDQTLLTLQPVQEFALPNGMKTRATLVWERAVQKRESSANL